MKKPEDQMLLVMVQALVLAIGTRSDALFLIDKNYELRRVFSRNEHGSKQASKVRSDLLRSGELLVVLATGWSSEASHHVVLETYPTPGQVETYALSYPKPVPVWDDPEDDDAQDAIVAFKEFWKP